MGYDPNDKAGLEAMRKGAGKRYGGSLPGQPGRRICWGKIVVVTTVVTVPCGMKVGFDLWLGFVAGLRGHAAVNRHALFGPKPSNQYGLPVWLVPW
jgi:hypothetical protein